MWYELINPLRCEISSTGGTVRDRLLSSLVITAALASCTSHVSANSQGHTTPPFSASPTTSKSIATSNDVYKGWKSYHSEWESATFRYPARWTKKVEPLNVGINGGGEQVTLTAPNGYQVVWTAPLSGVGGGCVPSAPHVFIDRILTMPSVGSRHRLYVALSSVQKHKNLAVVDVTSLSPALKIGDTKDCLYYPTFGSRRNASLHAVQFTTGSASHDPSIHMTDNQFIGTPDARVALLIF